MAESVERRVLAERKTEQAAVTSTQSGGQAGSGLLRLRKAARRDASLRFNNLLHHISVDRLEQAYLALNRQAATGVDGQTWEGYGANLQENLQDLHRRIHTGSYHPQPSRRVWIPKADGRQRQKPGHT